MSSSGEVTSVMDRSNLNRELTPLLVELVTLGPGNNEHPSVRQIFNYLVDPERTGEEFTHVIGNLASEIIEEHFPLYEDDGPCMYLAKIAAEALAIKCPVLVGAWEAAAWKLFQLWYCRDIFIFSNIDVLSKRCGAWIIHIIGDPDICPNPSLRLELMALLLRMVDINANNQTQAFESVMSACSLLNTKMFKLDTSSAVNFNEIGKIFGRFAEDWSVLEFDRNLAEQLLNVKASRCSAIVHDVGYLRAKNSTRYTQPRELYGLFALLQTIDETLKDDLLQYRILETEGEIHKFLTSIGDVSNVLSLITCNFTASCESPKLVGLTASCIMRIVELGVITKICLEDVDIEEKIGDILSNVFNEIEDAPEDASDNYPEDDPENASQDAHENTPQDGPEYDPRFIFTNVGLEMFQMYQNRINILEDLVYGGEPNQVKEWIEMFIFYKSKFL